MDSLICAMQPTAFARAMNTPIYSMCGMFTAAFGVRNTVLTVNRMKYVWKRTPKACEKILAFMTSMDSSTGGAFTEGPVVLSLRGC